MCIYLFTYRVEKVKIYTIEVEKVSLTSTMWKTESTVPLPLHQEEYDSIYSEKRKFYFASNSAEEGMPPYTIFP